MPKTPRLREWRERAALSQGELAARSGTSRATIADLEAGNRGGQPKTVRRLAEALGIEPEDLYGEAVYPKEERRSSLEPSFNDVLAEERRVAYLRTWRTFIHDLRERWLAESEEFLEDEEPNDYGALAWGISNRETADSIWRTIVNGLIMPPAPFPPEGPELTELEAVCDAIDALRDLADGHIRQVVMEVHARAKARQAAVEESRVEEFQKADEKARRAREEIRLRTQELSA